jgi:hypothetical protein
VNWLVLEHLYSVQLCAAVVHDKVAILAYQDVGTACWRGAKRYRCDGDLCELPLELDALQLLSRQYGGGAMKAGDCIYRVDWFSHYCRLCQLRHGGDLHDKPGLLGHSC